MADIGLLDTSDSIQPECIRNCFLKMNNDDLQKVKMHWNQHTIGRNRSVNFPGGKPDVLYFQPEMYTARDYKMPLPMDIAEVEIQDGRHPPASGVSLEFEVIADNMIRMHHLQPRCSTMDEATDLFVEMMHHINSL